MQLLVPKPSDFPAFLRPEGEVAVKELCESLESTRGLLAEWAGQAQCETTALEPLPQDRRSLAFVQAVFKHNFSPSNIEDAVIALKDFQFEVESCQQTTELAFQQVWRVYEIVKSQTLQRRSSFSTISSISTQISDSSTRPQATTGFRRETIDWLKGLVASSKTNSETPNLATQTEREARAGTAAEGNTSAPSPPATKPQLTITSSPPPHFVPSPPASSPLPSPIDHGSHLTSRRLLSVLVIAPYEAQEDDEIDLVEGEYIYDVGPLVNGRRGGWWRGTTQGGKRGMFPASCVEECATPNKAEVPPLPLPEGAAQNTLTLGVQESQQSQKKRKRKGDYTWYFTPSDGRWSPESRSRFQEPF